MSCWVITVEGSPGDFSTVVMNQINWSAAMNSPMIQGINILSIILSVHTIVPAITDIIKKSLIELISILQHLILTELFLCIFDKAEYFIFKISILFNIYENQYLLAGSPYYKRVRIIFQILNFY